jgi:nucleotide-binding universal stress UspA family protein
MIIRHILVPLDFSETTDQALAYAIAFTRPLQARLTLLHVLQIPPLTLEDGATALSGTYLEDLETEAQHLLEASLAHVQRAGLQGDCLLVQGTPTPVIVDTASVQEVDLIIMGTHGRTGLTHVLMGSVAERVVREAPCPVLVTRKTRPRSGTHAMAAGAPPAQP